MVNDFTETDFFRDDRLVENPYPYFEALRQQCPVARENHHGVTMVTGWDEAVEVFNDAATFSSCISVTGPFPGFPVPLEGDLEGKTVTEQHRDELPFSDQLPTLDPPTHTNHRALLMRLITPKRLKENEDAVWVLADRVLDTFLAPGRAETRVAIERLLDQTTDIRISERAHGPANDRRYQYVPTYILRGLTELHLEFTLAGESAR
ncbi:MAG: hypothetical protein ACRDT5_01970 [Mycobacterium sp.]